MKKLIVLLYGINVLFLSCSGEKSESKKMSYCDCYKLQLKMLEEYQSNSAERNPIKIQELEKEHKDELKQCHEISKNMTEDEKLRQVENCK